MKQTILLVLVVVIATSAFGKTTTHTLDFGSYAYSTLENETFVSEIMQGATYRFDTVPDDVGFYYGFEYTMAYPTYRYIKTDIWDFNVTSTPYRSFMQLTAPVGYRWAGEGKKSGFYLGAGLAFHLLYGYDEPVLGGLGIASELGWQTNRTEDTGFHFGLRSGWTPLVFREGSGVLSANGFTSSLRLGISWRRRNSQ